MAANANDGNRASYWESSNNALPQWIQADLGSSVRVDRVVLRLPDGWEPRTQTLKIQGSTNGSDFTDLTASKAYAFNAAGGETATISFDATTTRYVRVLVTANTGQPGRPALRAGGLRPRDRRHRGADRARPSWPTPSRPPVRSG